MNLPQVAEDVRPNDLQAGGNCNKTSATGGNAHVELSFRKGGSEFVARMNFPTPPQRLKRGGRGWFEVGFVNWRFDWKLRVQCSITRPGPNYGYGQPQAALRQDEGGEQVFTPKNNDFVRFLVRNGTDVSVVFQLPDCIYPFQRTTGWGCAAGGPISIEDVIFHCSAMLIAKPPDYNTELRLTEEGIEFLESFDCKKCVLGHMDYVVRGKDPVVRALSALSRSH